MCSSDIFSMEKRDEYSALTQNFVVDGHHIDYRPRCF